MAAYLIDYEESFEEEIVRQTISNFTSSSMMLHKVLLSMLADSEVGEDGSSSKRPRFRYEEPRPQYWDSTWGRMLKDPNLEDPNSRVAKLFRRRFRIPYPVFQFIVSQCKAKNLFSADFQEEDITGRRTPPFELKLLGVLRIIGRNWCLDDVNESSGISESTMQRFFHRFCRIFVANFWDDFVKKPDVATLDAILEVYARLGLPGCIGSIDCVHLRWDMCPVSWTNICQGKEGYPSLVFEICCSHNRKILSCTNYFWGTINDKTIVKYDDYVMAVKEGRIWADITFKVVDENGTERTMTGVWFLCDNGYHRWKCLQAPIPLCSELSKIYWSEWMESVRKDVECCFGILKARFRFLREGIKIHCAEEINNVMHLCCILHNMLLEFDGLDAFDEEQWEKLNPQKESHDDCYDDNANFVGPLPRNGGSVEERRIPTESDVVVEVDEDHEERKNALVQHFKFCYDHGTVCWPRGFKEFHRGIFTSNGVGSLPEDRLRANAQSRISHMSL
jgi:hypothetical protein